MFNKAKRVIAVLLSVTTLLSAAACSKAPESTEETATVASAASSRDVAAIRAEIKKKTADIIATLEVGKTYDELPVTPKKLGVERFEVERVYLDADGNLRQDDESRKWLYYVDVTDEYNMVYKLETNVTEPPIPLWVTGNNTKITQGYWQLDNKYCTFSQHCWEDIGMSKDGDSAYSLIGGLGYDVLDVHNNAKSMKYTYVGTEAIDGYAETLIFEATDGTESYKYNVDPETGFWVKFWHECVVDGPENGRKTISSYFSKVVVEPETQTPDFESNLVDGKSVNNDYDKALAAYLKAFGNRDSTAVYEMTPPMEHTYLAISSYCFFLNMLDREYGENSKIEFTVGGEPTEIGNSRYTDEINGTVTESKLIDCAFSVDGEDMGVVQFEAYNVEGYGWRFALHQ